MNAPKSIALITCGIKGLNTQRKSSHFEHVISKIYVHNNEDSKYCQLHYPNAEFVEKKEYILQDSSIDHVIIFEPASEDLPLIAEVLKSGKNVQILRN